VSVKRSVVTGVVALVALFAGVGIGGATVPPRTATATTTFMLSTTTTVTATVTATETATYTVTQLVTLTSYVTKTTTLPPVVVTAVYSITIPAGGYEGLYRVGEPIRIGSFEFSVVGYTETRYIKVRSRFYEDYYYYYEAMPQHRIIVVWLTVKNVGTRTDNPRFSFPRIYLVTTLRNTYGVFSLNDLKLLDESEVDPTVVSQAIEWIDADIDLAPGEAVTVTIPFHIPEREDPAALFMRAWVKVVDEASRVVLGVTEALYIVALR